MRISTGFDGTTLLACASERHDHVLHDLKKGGGRRGRKVGCQAPANVQQAPTRVDDRHTFITRAHTNRREPSPPASYGQTVDQTRGKKLASILVELVPVHTAALRAPSVRCAIEGTSYHATQMAPALRHIFNRRVPLQDRKLRKLGIGRSRSPQSLDTPSARGTLHGSMHITYPATTTTAIFPHGASAPSLPSQGYSIPPTLVWRPTLRRRACTSTGGS